MECILCAHLRPHSKPHHQEGQSCEKCSTLLADLPGHIAEGYPLLVNLLYPWQTSAMFGHRAPSPEPRLPIAADIWELLVGVPRTLGAWALDWIDVRAMRELETTGVPALAKWLGDRADWAAHNHPAVDEYASEVLAIRRRLRGLVGVADGEDDEGRAQPAGHERPMPIVGVPCWRCDQMTLTRAPGSDDVKCQNPGCLAVRRPDEYERWTRLLVVASRRHGVA